MRRPLNLLFAASVISAAWACAAKETPAPQPTTDPVEEAVTIKVRIPEGTVGAQWKQKDEIAVSAGEKREIFKLDRILQGGQAEFIGNKIEADKYDILYPADYTDESGDGPVYNSPAQKGNGSTDHIVYYAKLTGVDNCTDVTFSSEWAARHKGGIQRNAVIKLTADVTGLKAITSLSLGILDATLVLPLEDIPETETLTAYLTCPFDNLEISSVTVSVTDAEGTEYSTEHTISGRLILSSETLNAIGPVRGLGDAGAGGGSGTMEDPFLIADATQLDQMHEILEQGQKKYFRLIKDIDASSIENWVPLNGSGSFDKPMDFDGNGHTISNLTCRGTDYASFAGVLNGSIKDVTFSNATITGNARCGVVAGLAGSTTFTEKASCSGVRVVNSSVTGTSFTGGFAGEASCAAFSGCSVTGGSVNNSASGKNVRCGGFVGSVGSTASFGACTVSGTSVKAASAGRTGGFVGQLGETYQGGNGIVISSCGVEESPVEGGVNTGGFVGVQYNDIVRCSVSGGSVKSSVGQCGGFTAFQQNGACTHCFSSADVTASGLPDAGGFAGLLWNGGIQFCYAAGSVTGGSNTGAFVGRCAKQGTEAPGSVTACIGWNASLPLCGSNTVGATLTNCYAGTGGSVSAKAKELGWPIAIWDLNGSMPALLPGDGRIPAVFIGDSITWQWARVSRSDTRSTVESATHGFLTLDPLPSYMTQDGSNIITRFHPEFFTLNGYVNRGISGQNTTEIMGRYRQDVLDLNPRVVVIMAGTNDLAQGVSEDDIFANIATMASQATEAGIKVVLCTITPCNRSYSRLKNPSTKGAHIEALNARFKALAEASGYLWCDYWTSLVAAQGEVQDPADIGHGLKDRFRLYDDLHPGPDAYTVMEGIIKPILDGIGI